MPNNELSLDQVLNMDLKPLEQVADSEAKYKKNLERFNFDPSVSIADEIEIQRQQEIEQIKAKAQKQKATENFIYQNESNARIGSDDIDGLNGIASSLNSLSGVRNLSINSMESKLVDINADKVGGVFKSIAEDLNRQNAVSRAQEKTSAFGQLKSFDKTKKPENTISPVKNNGNKYLNAVKRGSASIIQLGSLLYDGGYEAFERGADLVTGFDVNGRSPYKTNRVFNAMQELKQEKYKQSDSFNNLMFGSEIAGAEAKESGNNETIASLQYLAKNGSLGDAGEVLAEFIPSLYLGAGIGSLAGKGAGSLTGSYVSNSVGRSIATNSIINPTRLAAIEVLTPRVVQGAVMAGSSDFIGSMATETEFQKQSYSDSEAVSRALTRSLAQAGVSALGGSLLPLRVGGDLATVSTQAVIQGLAGYASGYAGARSIGEDYSSTEAAMNILVGAVTALPEVVVVGGLSVNKADIQTHLDDLIVDRAIANVTNQQEIEESRSSYFGANVRDLISRVKSSKTNQRSPETVREFIRSAQDEDAAVQTEAYIDAETFNQLSTEYNIDLDSLFNTYPELSREYQRANEIDGVIRMSLDEMAIAFSQVDNEQYLNAFSDSLRHHPEAMTAGEARAEFSKNTEEMKADIQEIKQKFENEKVKIKELKTVSDIIGNDLSNLNFKFSADYNNQAKALVSAFYETLADKTGVSAMELYKSMPLRIVSNEDEAIAVNGEKVKLFNPEEKINIVNNDVETISSDSFKNWFGDWEKNKNQSSKAVDEDGKPKVFYHGTNLISDNGEAFSEFNTYGSKYGLMGVGSYFTENKKIAQSYTNKEKGKTPKVYEVFLNIRNPIDMDKKTNGSEWINAFDGIEDYHEGGSSNESWFRAAELKLRDDMIPSYEGAEIMQDGIRGMGYDGITHIGGGRVDTQGVEHRVFIAFEPEQIKSIDNNGSFDSNNPNIYLQGFNDKFGDSKNQKLENSIRGQIQFRTDKKGAVIILGKNADFSTFAHELGHHFLEMSMSFATRPDAPEQLKDDMIKVMEWSKQGKGIEDWKNLSPEQKTEVHEKFAETFEQYMFTGKAPSNELRKVFSRFRSFMASVYGNIQKFLGVQSRADLNPEIRDVMDRMLASQEAIEQVQKQRNLEFSLTEEQATQMGISPKDYLIMVDEHKEATEKAINELEQRTLKDLARYRTLRNKHVKAFSEQQKRVRQQTREKVAEEVAQMPVYQALAFLRQPVERPEKVKRDPNVVDPKVDTLLEAIAKMGGINSKEIESTWGIDQPESYKANVGRVKKISRKDGLSIETVAERLASDGYLKTDENGKLDIHEFENLFSDSLAGGKYYSNQADHDLFMMGDDYGLAWGQIDEFPVSGKLNIEALKARYGEESEIYKAVAKTGQYGLAMKDGLDPDLVASQFGYESGDALIKDLANAPTPKEVIEQRSNELIQARDSDLFDDQSIEMAIDEAVHNDIRAMMLARELTAITQLKGRQSEFNETAKAMAQNIIDKSLVTEIRPHLFSSADLRHAKAYDKALKAGDTTGAVRAKRQQLINFHATKQAYEANRFIDKLFDLSKIINGNDAKLAKARDFNLVAISRYVLNLYGVSDNPSNFVEHIENLKKYDPTAASQISDLFYMKDAEGNTIPRIEIKDYTEMTFEEFTSLNDMVRQIWHKSKESQKIKVGDERIEFTKVVEDLVSATSKKPAKSRAGSFLGYTPRKAGDFNPQRAFQTLKRAEQLFTWLDGGKSNGFFHKYVFNPMQDSLTSYRLEQKKMMQEMVNIYSEFDVVHGKIDASELGGDRTTFESKQELLHAILHTGNESNKSRLVQGFGWGEKLEDGSVDYSKWDSFIGRMFDEGVITKKDMDSIQKIWNLFDGYKEQAQRVHKNLNGLYFKELPKSKVITPFGEYDGGYIPADYDRLRSAEAEQRGKANASTEDAPFYNGGASTGANFTKSRVESYRGDYMTLDMSQLPMHLDRELRYIHLEENLKQASKIFRNKDVMSGIESVSPFAIDAIISDWLGAVANQRVSKPSSMPTFDRFVEKLKQNSGIVLMAGNIKNAVEAWTSIPQLTIAVPKKELASTSAKFFVDLASRESMTKQVRELSPFMNSRLDRSVNEMRYQLEGIVTNPSAFKKGSDFLKQNAYFVQQVFQTPLETIGWMSAFNDAQTKGMSEADAIHHADGIVRMYLNDMSPEGISKVERGNALQRAMLMFYGWFNMVHNTFSMNKNLISETSELGNLKKYGQYAGLYVMMIAMPAMLSKALTLSFNGELFNNEDAEDWSDDLVNITVKSQAEMIFGMMPFARDIINPIYRSTFNATIYSDRYSVSPIQSMAENLVKTGKSVTKAASGDEVDASNITKGVLQGATFATGVPFTLIQRPTVYGVDVLVDEDQEPESIGDAVRGTLNGR